jgi:hypothetical protein
MSPSAEMVHSTIRRDPGFTTPHLAGRPGLQGKSKAADQKVRTSKRNRADGMRCTAPLCLSGSPPPISSSFSIRRLSLAFRAS